ncbi:hypothetical protein [Maribacter sp. 4G9]|uniref:hypothetical protein n=1 Tax=Maribacter sp. 4G9 TaxID=1889777 RepID=UPI000C14E93E|nr:hypothetical protein [Maribacter sp. 4G9]PIB38541.1 hypothetical protein BFP75_15920 [Maribacter sp. 4G9]
MKYVLLSLTLILCLNIAAQNSIKAKNGFVRVYNVQGKKIGKGKILNISETSLQLIRHGETTSFTVNEIGKVKTKRSGGNNVLVGALSGAVTFAIIGVASNDPDSQILRLSNGEAAVAGAFVGGTLGTGIGVISLLFKNSKTFEINGDIEKWNVFKEMIPN